MINADLMINAGQILTINANNDILLNHSIIVNENIIIDILPTKDACLRFQPKETINAENKILMPGFINTHTHIAMSFFKGLADDLPLDKWLNEYIWPAEAKCLNPEFVYEASIYGIAELLKSGITFFNDMYFFPEETINACLKSGIRAVIGDIALDFPMGDFHNPKNNLNKLEEYINLCKSSQMLEMSIAPHSVYTCFDETWKKCIELAQKHNLLIHTHLSETSYENSECKKLNNGLSPLQYLNSLNIFSVKTLFAHGVHIDDADMQLLKNKDTSIAININSNLKLASGFPPIPEYKETGICVSIGTDSVASNNQLNAINELNTIAKLYKAMYKNPQILSAKELVRMATIDSAKALGKEMSLGSIEIGKYADVISIEISNHLSQPLYDPYSYIIYSMDRQFISDVIINGKIVLKDKEFQNFDDMELLHFAEKNKKIVLSRIGK